MSIYELFLRCQRLLATFFAQKRPAYSVPHPVSTPIMSQYTFGITVKPGAAPENAKAHHVKYKDGRPVLFENPFPSYGWKGVSLLSALFVFGRYRITGKLPVPKTSDAKIPFVSPTFLPSRQPRAGNALRATWLGHASCFVEFPSGFRALFDPVFEEKFNATGPKRFTPPACQPGDFPALDAVFISHNHHDHLSLPTVKELLRLYPNVHFFVGLNMAKWFQESGVSSVTEMEWWDDAEVVLERTANSDKTAAAQSGSSPESISVRVSCLPSQHGCMRTGFDKDRALWASWAVESGGKSVWFAGDTGYRCVPEGIEELGPGFDKLPRNPQFAQIGLLRGPFDLGLIPIGAYAPRYMYSPVHASPLDAVEIFQDTRCRKALGIHWGTWALTSEPVEEPPVKLKEALEVKGLAQTGLFDVCAIGESREF